MNHENEPTPAYYAVIPANVRYCKSLKPNAKLLYGEITALANKKGFCWATNGYFSELYDVEDRAVRDWISQLQKEGFIWVELVKNETGTTRKISIIPEKESAETPPPVGENSPPPVGENSPPRRLKITAPTVKNHLHNNTVEYKEVIAKAIPSFNANNSNELLANTPPQKNQSKGKNQNSPALIQTPAQDSKEKSCAKKESAITVEFKQRGFEFLAKAKLQPSDAWYEQTVVKYGQNHFWAIFERIEKHCADKKPYSSPARAFSEWAISLDGLAAFDALQAYSDAKKGSKWCELMELSQFDKQHLEGIGVKIRRRVEEKAAENPQSQIPALKDVVLKFFQRLPAYWSSRFSLRMINENLPQILDEIHSANGAPANKAQNSPTSNFLNSDDIDAQILENIRQKRQNAKIRPY